MEVRVEDKGDVLWLFQNPSSWADWGTNSHFPIHIMGKIFPFSWLGMVEMIITSA